MLLSSTEATTLMIHDTQNGPASQPAEMVSMMDIGTWKASQSFKKKNKQSCIYMMNQNPLLGFIANPQVPRIWSFIFWLLPLF